jgi:putative sigma-54 modulation protein
MELLVRGTDVTISDDLRAFAKQRVSKLDRLVEHLVEAKLEIKRIHRRTGANYIVAQLTVQSGRDLLRAEEQDGDARKAIDLAVTKMETQIRKVNSRRLSRKKAGPLPDFNGLDLDNGAGEDLEIDDELQPVVRTKRFNVKPMGLEEAVEQMELLGHDFFVFHNLEEGNINVLYRRKDGAYGLLAPTEG